MLAVEGLTVTYNGAVALDGVSLEIREGEMVALIGSNGAGKSTLLNTLSGLVTPKAGSIRFDRRDIVGLRPSRIARSGLLQVPEGRQILGDLTVEENLTLGALALGARKPEYTFDAIVSLFPILGNRRRQKGGSLSGGEQQMLAIGRALMGAPKLLLLDEPSLGLAPRIVEQVFSTLTAINERGLTILLVEQNAKRALSVADRAYVLEQGRVALSGQSDVLAKDPAIEALYLGNLAG